MFASAYPVVIVDCSFNDIFILLHTCFCEPFLWYNPALDTNHGSTPLSRLIKTDSAGKDRTRLTKGIVLAVRELAKQNDVTTETKDLAAFIALALQTIADGIDESVAAWEKRNHKHLYQ